MATKIVKDPIHGFIELNPLVVKIIDTPQFQRLRHLKQNGATYYVYPGASHNRFEHCLGTYHLASRLLHELRKRLREVQETSEENDEIKSIDITDRDVLRVEIAALCHDLGHGPFSHMFEDLFLKQVRGSEHKTHEDASKEMLESLVEDELDILLKADRQDSTVNKYKGLTRSDLDFIKECIKPETAQKEKGKEFLYEIVSNSSTGIDVDKWDYFARDCHHLGMQNLFDHERYLKTARVVKHPEEDRWTIAYRQKDVDQVYEMYQTRRSLHRKACHHPVVKCIELMISEAFIKADKYIEFKGKKGKKTLSTAIDDVVAYTQLTDEVVQKIAWIDVDANTDQDLWKARELIKRIMRRDLYLYIGDFTFKEQKEQDIDLKDSLKKMMKEKLKAEGNDEYVDKYVAIHAFPLDVGKGKNDPTTGLILYEKGDLRKGKKNEEKSRLFPNVFREMHAHVYFKSSPRDKMDEQTKLNENSIYEKLKEAFQECKKDQNIE